MVQQTGLPRWKGFNLQPMFRVLPHEGKTEDEMTAVYRPHESDFQFMADNGFDYARIAMSYKVLCDHDDPYALREDRLALMDEVVTYGQKYGVHIDLSLHRAPGYCILDSIPVLAGPDREQTDLWTDKATQQAFADFWGTVSKRYAGISSKELSFNLVNEPRMVPAEVYTNVVKDCAAAIHRYDKERLILADGLNTGNSPVIELGHMAKNHVAQACRGYIPHGVSHHRLAFLSGVTEEPKWPGATHNFENYEDLTPWDADKLDALYRVWATVSEAYHMGVHCSEMGCGMFTPHKTALRWLEDVLFILKKYNIGFGMWNLHGCFGVLNSGRTDVQYEDYKGNLLDREMLDLMKRY